ncbi:putative zinc finger, CCHC-type containing protein [Tanacetum coccineum]
MSGIFWQISYSHAGAWSWDKTQDEANACCLIDRIAEAWNPINRHTLITRLRDRRRKGRGITTIKSKLIKRKRRSGLCRAFGVLGLTTERRDGLKEKETKIAVAREGKEASPRTTQRKGLRAHSQQLKLEFERLVMKEDESIDSFAGKLMSIIIKAATCGLTFDEQTKVRKVLNAVPDNFCRNYKHNYGNGRRGGGNQTRGRWKDRDEGHTSDESEGTDNKSRRNGDKSQIDCYKCGKLWHYAYECANKKKEEVAALLVETDDEPALSNLPKSKKIERLESLFRVIYTTQSEPCDAENSFVKWFMSQFIDELKGNTV